MPGFHRRGHGHLFKNDNGPWVRVDGATYLGGEFRPDDPARDPQTRQWGDAHYGYGLTIAGIDCHSYLGHAGSTPGYVSAIIADVDDGLGVVVLVNGYVESYGVVGIAMHVLKLVRAGLHQDEIPPLLRGQ